MLKYHIVPVTPYEQNCTLIWCDQTQAGAVLDPGGETAKIVAAAQELGITLEQIWITHGHIDHAGGAATLAKQLNIPIYGSEKEDSFWIDNLSAQGISMPGLQGAEAFTPARWLNDLDEVHVGHQTLLIRHCPGHTPGHVVFYSKEAQSAFVGDVLFSGSIGRTDFPRGNYEQLIHSIVERLWPMGDDTVFIPGHGPQSTFGHERQTNPFVGGT